MTMKRPPHEYRDVRGRFLNLWMYGRYALKYSPCATPTLYHALFSMHRSGCLLGVYR